MAAGGSTSKRDSGASSASRPPPDVVFFLDRCLGRNVVAEALRAAGCRVEVHADHFAHDTPDADWLHEIGRHGWVVLTKDDHIHKNQIEVAALLRSGASSFVLRAGDATGSGMAAAFVAAAPTIRRFQTNFKRPFVATVTLRGHVSMLCTVNELMKRAAPL
jgi:hypothetical protein